MNAESMSSSPVGGLDALVFDFDGTLVHSSDIKKRAFLAAIAQWADGSRSDAERAYLLHGTLNRVPQLSNAFNDIHMRKPNDLELEGMLTTYGAFVREHRHEVYPFDGVGDLLSSLGPSCHLFIASNAPQGELDAACDALDLRKHFEGIYGYPTSKDDAIKTVLSDLGIANSRLLYIGDRQEDSAVAARTGVLFCRFGPLEPRGDDVILRTVPDLRRFVANAGG